MASKVQGSRAWEYFIESMSHNSRRIHIPQILFFSVICGVVGGLVASFYFFCLEAVIKLIWRYLFEALKQVHVFGPSFPEYNFIWMGSLPCIIMVCILLRVFAANGPGGFGPSAEKIHTEGKIPSHTFLPMFFLSLFSLSSGSGVGPEAPILGLGGAAHTFIGEKLNLPKRALRTFVLTGTSACLSAFFGTPFTGLFALEFSHRWGIEYFEAFVPSILSSLISSLILQSIFQRPFGSFFYFDDNLEVIHPKHALQGLLLGFVGAAVGATFYFLSTIYNKAAKRLSLDRFKYFLPLAAWVVFSVAGMMLPPIIFWGEPDFQNVIDLNIPPFNAPEDYPKPHWEGDSSGIFNLGQPFTPTAVFLIGLVKLLVLPFNVTMNLKGGIVFPLFFIGGTFGQLIHMLTGVNQALAVTCVMAGAQASVTRTPFATVFVAVFNSRGPAPQLFVPVAFATFVSMLLTHKLDLFNTQRPREDLIFLDERAAIPQPTLSLKDQHSDVELEQEHEHEQEHDGLMEGEFDLGMGGKSASSDQILLGSYSRHS